MKNKLLILCNGLLLTGSILIAQDQVTTLEANGPGDTYDLIRSKLAPGEDPIEVPDDVNGDHPGVEHISEIFDTDLDKHVFKFDLHVTPDTDPTNDKTDRQRNEIKTFDKSPASLRGFRGDLMEYSWKFKMDANFQPSSTFTHLFQLKVKGGLDDPPVLTITPRKKNPNKLELIYRRDLGNGGVSNNLKVREADLSNFVGKWLEVTCRIYVNGTQAEIDANINGYYDNLKTPGSLDFTIKEVESGNVLMSYSNDDFDNDREPEVTNKGTISFKFTRPKWGIYRGLTDSGNLRDESVLFADFKITKIDQQLLNIGEFELEGPALLKNPVSDFIELTEKLSGSQFELYTLSGQLIKSSKDVRINVSDLTPGVYMLTIIDNSKQAVLKIIKN